MTEENDAESARSRRRKKKKRMKNYLAEGDHGRSASSRRRYYAVRIVRRRRRARGLLTQAICAALLDRLATKHEHPLKPQKVPTRQCYRRCRTAVELSINVTKCARFARECIFARVVGGSKAHSRSRSVGRRGGRAQDTNMVIRRVCGIVVTVYLALILEDGDD